MMTRLVPPPVALLTSLMLVYALSRLWPVTTVDWPWLPWLASALLAVGLGLMLAAAWALWRSNTTINPIHPERTRHLVIGGIYQISRNPIYLGDALLIAGATCWLGQPVGLIVVALFVLFIDGFQIPAEERALGRLFGERYTDYRRDTRRWL